MAGQLEKQTKDCNATYNEKCKPAADDLEKAQMEAKAKIAKASQDAEKRCQDAKESCTNGCQEKAKKCQEDDDCAVKNDTDLAKAKGEKCGKDCQAEIEKARQC